MNVLILGSGGREHTIAWKISQSAKINNLLIAPGNGGTQQCGQNVSIDISDFEAVKKLVIDQKIELVIVGPEAPLVQGISDYFKNTKDLQHVHIIGPSKAGAELEGSKDFAKKFMMDFNIPTAKYKSFTKYTLSDGYAFLETLESPYVLKADGLAAGKGVLILDDLEEAQIELQNMLEGKFGEASSVVVIEEFLKGIEVSCFCYTNGKDYVMLPEAKDYKRIGKGDTGLNTGGMGSISPVPFADEEFKLKVQQKIVDPTIKGLQEKGIDYHGFIFFGLISIKGEPYVIEYNVRLGDPETESILPRIDTDLMDMFEAGINNSLYNFKLKINPQTAASVMLVSGGYPGSYEKGKEISNLPTDDSSIILHAGTKEENGKMLTNGGRVIAVTSIRDSMQEALDASMQIAENISFEKKYYRKDLGFDL